MPKDSRRADHASVLRVQRAPAHAARALRPEVGRRPGGVPADGRGRRRRDRELPPRRRRPPRHRVGHASGPEPRASCTARPAGSDRRARARSGPATTSITSRSAASCTAPDAVPTGSRRCRALTLADSAGGGMHAVMAILAALVRRATTGEGAYLDVSIADGVLGLMALAVDEYLATGEEPAPRHGLLTGRYACYDTYPTRDGGGSRSPRSSRASGRTSASWSGCAQWAAHQERRRGAGPDPRRVAGGVPHA